MYNVLTKVFQSCIMHKTKAQSTPNAYEYALIAQVAERILGKDEVTSSNLVKSSKSACFLTFLMFTH